MTLQDKVLPFIPANLKTSFENTCTLFNITTMPRLLHFISQTKHESSGYKFKEENLNYSADSLMKTFSKYFPEKSLALTYERKPIAIASKVYANRNGNGDEASRDGWTYRGRGAIQLTGKANYKAFGDFIGVDLTNNPDEVANKYFFESAGFFWHRNNLNSICDKGLFEDVVKELTKKINGGYNGLGDRLEILNDLCKQLSINK